MRRRAAMPTVAVAGTLALALLAGCASLTSGDGNDGESSEPEPVHSQAPTIDPAEAAVDVDRDRAVDPDRIVDPGWDMAAQEADGVFLSLHENRSTIEFRAVGSTGEILWTAERPRVCSGFLVSDTEEGPVAVLMDQQPESGHGLSPTASGYDLATGENLWGPVDVPGPLLGSGLVFAAPPKDFIGAGGRRVAVNPSTGKRLAVEDADETDDAGAQKVIALLDRHLVLSDGRRLVARDLSGHQLWSRNARELGLSTDRARELPWESIGGSYALVGSASGGDRRIIDVESGHEVAAGLYHAGFDARTQTLITVDEKLHGFGPDGDEKWKRELPADAELTAVGAGLIVIDSFSDVASGTDGTATSAVFSVTTGKRFPADREAGPDREAADSARTGLGAAHHIAESGAGLIGDPGSPLLMTTAER